MYGLDTKISQKQQLFVFALVAVALGSLVFFGCRAYFNTQNAPSMTQSDSVTPPPSAAVVPPVANSTPPAPQEKPVATVIVSVTEASGEAPAEEESQ